MRNHTLDWAQKATTALGSDLKLRANAWAHLSWSGPEEFGNLAATATALHEAGKLFVSEVAAASSGSASPPVEEEELDPEQEVLFEDEGDDDDETAVPPAEPPAADDEAAEPPSEPPVEPPVADAEAARHKVLERCVALRLVYGRGM